MRSPVSLFIRDLKSGLIWYARFLKPSTFRYEATKSTGIEVKGKKYDEPMLQTILLSHEFVYSTTTPTLRGIIAADAGLIVLKYNV